MYETFYGLQDNPFRLAADPRYLYRSARHEAALSYLEYGIADPTGFILLTGEVGSGKTTLVNYILGRLSRQIEAAVIFNTNVTALELLALILEGFGSGNGIPGDKPGLLKALGARLKERWAQRKRLVLILDEAQNLSAEALEEVRLLSNLRSGGHPLLQVLIVGQPELAQRLRDPALRHFTQRISASYHLTALDREETAGYIAFRLNQAGGRPDLFAPEAVDRIYALSGGIPRAVNRLCQAALVYGFAEGAAQIGAEIVRQVCAEHLGLAAEKMPAAAAAPPGGNGAKAGWEAIGLELRELKAAIDRQAEVWAQQRAEKPQGAIDRLERLLAAERSRNAQLTRLSAELVRRNKALKALGLKLKAELQRRPPA